MPQVLLCENVPDIIGTKNIKHFAKWLEKLESLGYKCYWKVLNGKDYGIPQNRERFFMVSILGDYFYDFPNPIELKIRLKHLLETQVDENFYLSDMALKGLQNTTFNCSTLEAQTEIAEPLVWDGFNQQIRADSSVVGTLTKNCGQDLKRNGQGIIEPTVINPLKDKTRYGWHFEQQVYDADGITRVVKAGDGSGNIPKVVEPLNLKQQLCNELVQSGLLKEYDVVNHSYTNGLCGKNPNSRQNLEDYIESTDGIMPALTTRPDIMGTMTNYRIRKLTPRECWRLMGVKDEDFERVAKNQSNSSLYHLAGDSIITTVLMAIFGEMVGIDWQTNTEWKYGEETEQ